MIQMITGNSANGTFQLPQPSNAVITAAGGFVSVDPSDVRLAMTLGWAVMAGQRWPQTETVRMIPPLATAAEVQMRPLPDGSFADCTQGFAVVPIQMRNYLLGLGWCDGPTLVMLKSAAASSASFAWAGGPGCFFAGTQLTVNSGGALVGTFNGATVGLYYSTDGAVTWSPANAAAILSGLGGYVGFNLPPSLIQARIVGGPPSGVYSHVTAGNFL